MVYVITGVIKSIKVICKGQEVKKYIQIESKNEQQIEFKGKRYNIAIEKNDKDELKNLMTKVIKLDDMFIYEGSCFDSLINKMFEKGVYGEFGYEEIISDNQEKQENQETRNVKGKIIWVKVDKHDR